VSSPVVRTAPHAVATTDSVTATTVLPPVLLLLPLVVVMLAVLMAVMVGREAPAALTDVHGHVVRVRLVTAGPREARSQAQYLVELRPQHLVLVPAAHPRVDDGQLVLGVEEHVLAALVGRVDELEREPTCRHDGDVGQVAVPVLVRLKVTLVDTRL